MLSTVEKVHSSTPKSTTNFGPVLLLLFFALILLKIRTECFFVSENATSCYCKAEARPSAKTQSSTNDEANAQTWPQRVAVRVLALPHLARQHRPCQSQAQLHLLSRKRCLRLLLMNSTSSTKLIQTEKRRRQFSSIIYASWGPEFWPFLRSSARALTIKAVRGAVATNGVFDN